MPIGFPVEDFPAAPDYPAGDGDISIRLNVDLHDPEQLQLEVSMLGSELEATQKPRLFFLPSIPCVHVPRIARVSHTMAPTFHSPRYPLARRGEVHGRRQA